MAAIIPIIGGPTRLSFLSLTPRLFQPFLRPSWSLPCEHSSSSPPAFSSSTSALTLPLEAASSSWTSTLDSFLELFPSILLAVPKKKVSHSRKSMRSANKGLKNKTNFSHCSACGRVKLSHHLCPDCYSQISRGWKAQARGEDPWATSPVANESPVEGRGVGGSKESAATA